MAWAGTSPVGILPRGAPSTERISPRGCQKMPQRSLVEQLWVWKGFAFSTAAMPVANLHWRAWDLMRLDHLAVTSAAFSCARPSTRQLFFLFLLKAEQFLWEKLSQPYYLANGKSNTKNKLVLERSKSSFQKSRSKEKKGKIKTKTRHPSLDSCTRWRQQQPKGIN